MSQTPAVPQVGAPDSELKNSPILDEGEEGDMPPLGLELETSACWFNNVRYPLGQYVRSGDEVLRCAEGGVWVRVGEVPG